MANSKLETLRNGTAHDSADIVSHADLTNEELRAALANALDRIAVLEGFLDEFHRVGWEAMVSVGKESPDSAPPKPIASARSSTD